MIWEALTIVPLIGSMTDELKVSHLFKRLTAAQLMFGDSDTHLQRFTALSRT